MTGKPSSIIKIILVLGILAAFPAVWRWTPLRQWVDIKQVLSLAACIREAPLAPVIVIGAFTLGGLVMFPATLLVVATAITFEPIRAFIYALLGCLSSAVMLFFIGHMVGRETVHRVVGTRIHRLSQALGRRGLVTVITVRMIPVGPYSIVNFVAGVSHIRFKDYVLGTVIGLTPWLVAFTVFGARVESALQKPGLQTVLVLVALVVFIALANIGIHRRLGKKNADETNQTILESTGDE
jgi:phospholipase D1/2